MAKNLGLTTILTKEKLIELYFKDGLSFNEIGLKYNLKNIAYYFKKYGIDGRKSGWSAWNKDKKLLNRTGSNHPRWKGGKNKCLSCEKILSNRVAKKCKSCVQKGNKWGVANKGKIPKNILANTSENYRKMGLLGAKVLYERNPTSIELKVYEVLKDMGILFETQKLINGRFCVDAYIPSLNLVVEVDGGYWHSLPKIIKKDKAENAYLTKCGYNLIRLTEEDINSGSFKQRLEV